MNEIRYKQDPRFGELAVPYLLLDWGWINGGCEGAYVKMTKEEYTAYELIQIAEQLLNLEENK